MNLKAVIIFLNIATIFTLDDDDTGTEDDLEEMGTSTVAATDATNEETVGLTIENELDEDNVEWMKTAILDVAYYVRRHKFNNFDRRFKNKSVAELNVYSRFPNPPLRILHWEVEKYCSDTFINCLKYLHETVLESDLQRDQDTKVLMKSHDWTLYKNRDIIKTVNDECHRLYQLDFKEPEPFRNSLERFQWTTTASYFMCWYTMQEHPSLSLFEESCDNQANCLDIDNPLEYISDPRADNKKPYQCALYSFCPEICCPTKTVYSKDECISLPDNPCKQDQLKSWACSLDRTKNTDFISLILNRWNFTCECDKQSKTEWITRFGMCLDLDECETNEHTCDPELQDCINKNGSFYCVCKPGFVGNGAADTSCLPNVKLDEAIARLNVKKRKYKTVWQDERGFSIIRGILRYFGKNTKEEE